MSNGRCLCCGALAVETLLDLGAQPPSNLFLQSPDDSYGTHPLVFGACNTCGLAQLRSPMPVQMVRCRHSWLHYNEPEGHLDDVAEKLTALVNLPQPRIRGLSYKDTSLLQRLSERGWADAGNVGPCASEENLGIERLQALITPDWAKDQIQTHGQADILLARHVLEHAHNPQAFIKACSLLVRPGGWMVFEVPGCESLFRRHEHCFIWEEHTLYFTVRSFQAILHAARLEVFALYEYPASQESSLLVFARNSPEHAQISLLTQSMSSDERVAELELLRAFAASFTKRAAGMHNFLQTAMNRRPAVMFGAGHLGIKAINFYGLRPYIAAVIDDFPEKQGRFLPGSGLPVVGSDYLATAKPGICLLGLNPERQAQVMAAHAGYAEDGGQWHSIFSCTHAAWESRL